MKKLDLFHSALLVPASLIGSLLAAQPSYTFTTDIEPYSDLASAPALVFDGMGWHQEHALDGQTLWFCAEPYTLGGNRQIWINEAGFVNVDEAPTSTIFLSLLFRNFGELLPVGGSGHVTSIVEGVSGHLIWKLQWKNYTRTTGPDGNFVNFQFWVHQDSGVMEFRYGARADGGATYTPSQGPNVGYYHASYDASNVYERLWLTGDPEVPTLSQTTVANFTGLSALPAEGTVYRLTPTFTILGIDEPGTGATLPFVAVVDPGLQRVSLSFSGPEEHGSIGLFDASGRTVLSTERHGDRAELSLASLPSGPYLIVYTNAHGARSTQRIMRL